eukprot:2436203-Alexandrium_andersonii.AAC.1
MSLDDVAARDPGGEGSDVAQADLPPAVLGWNESAAVSAAMSDVARSRRAQGTQTGAACSQR